MLFSSHLYEGDKVLGGADMPVLNWCLHAYRVESNAATTASALTARTKVTTAHLLITLLQAQPPSH
jgi:hypothetical protein